MMKNTQKTYVHLLGVVAFGLLLLPGCDWWSCKKEEPTATVATVSSVATDDKSPVLVTMNGKPFITEKMFNDERQEMFRRDPNLQYVATMKSPEEFDKICLDTMMLKLLAATYIKANKIDQTPEFKKDLDGITDLFYTQTFVNKLPIDVTQEDIKAFYDDNKAMLVVAPGGVETVGVKFDCEEAAQQFLAQAAGNPELLDALIEEQNLREACHDFGIINNTSCNVDEAIGNAVNTATTYPSLMLVQADNDYWVVNAHKKHEPTYFEFEAVKSKIEPVVARQKQVTAVGTAVEDLKKQYNVVVDSGFFAKKNKEAMAIMQKAVAEYQDSLQAQQEEVDQDSSSSAKLMTEMA